MTQYASALKRGYVLARKSAFVLALIWGAGLSHAQAGDLDQWIQSQAPHSVQVMLANIGPSAQVPNAAPGAVVASPSHDPDYRYFWVRDAALTMDTVMSLYERSINAADQARYLQILQDYVDFSRRNQLTPNLSGGADDLGLGEPKFNIDGSAYQSPWGRPQNDGPALRAITLIRLARHYLYDGHADWVRQKLYDSVLPARTVIKADLEFVSHHWRDASFDLWEEVKGDHFYTRMVQRRALIEGASLASSLGDGAAAQWYLSQAQALEQEISRHWDAGRGYITVTLNRVGGLDYKSSGLDVAIVLAALHAAPRGGSSDSFFTVTDDRVLATAEKISDAFHEVFPINARDRDWQNQQMGPGIGRYPEDRYSGTTSSQQGNPWFLATNALAELDYRCARAFEAQGRIAITPANVALFRRLKTFSRMTVLAGETIQSLDPRFYVLIRGLREEGDGYLRRSRFHADSSGAMSEQFNRDTGYMQSASELTWSHASVITAAWARGK